MHVYVLICIHILHIYIYIYIYRYKEFTYVHTCLEAETVVPLYFTVSLSSSCKRPGLKTFGAMF